MNRYIITLVAMCVACVCEAQSINRVPAPPTGCYIIREPVPGLSHAQSLSVLDTGLLKNTSTTGVLSIAIPGNDYYAPGFSDIPVSDGGTGASTASDALSNLGLTTAGKELVNDADASAQRTTLGLGTAAVSNHSAFPATTMAGHLLFSPTGTYDIGSSGGSKPQNLWVNNAGNFGSTVTSAGISTAPGASTGYILCNPATAGLVQGGVGADFGTTGSQHVIRSTTIPIVFYTGATMANSSLTGTERMRIDNASSLVRIGDGTTPGQLQTGKTVTADTDGGNYTALMCGGQIYVNTGDADGQTVNLPAASTGLTVTFYCTVAQNFNVNPDDADIILGLTNAAGDAIQGNAIGESVTLVAIDSTNWAAVSVVGSWTDID